MRRLWWTFWVVVVVSFSVLGWVGGRIYQEKPPIPAEVVTSDGRLLLRGDDIMLGQNVWQALGGMEVGSVWGHGSYVAPDWTADWLHRECLFVLDAWSQAEHGRPFAALDAERQAPLRARLVERFRTNSYEPATGRVVVDPARAAAFESLAAHYAHVFSAGRKEYAIHAGALTDPVRQRALAAFFFWTAWAASTQRPGASITHTHNWPYEPLVANRASGEAVVWTGVSIIMLLAGISAMVWFYVSRPYDARSDTTPARDPLLGVTLTPSQRGTLKYFVVVSALFLVQILAGVITAHYGVEGDAFYGIPLAKWLPYSVARSWHVQIGILWIATAWLAAGLFIGPLVSGVEPKGQKLGVDILFGALLTLVVGALVGQWASIMGKLGGTSWFYFGHQGYEYVDIGRVWQAGLLVGLFLWLFLVVRSIGPALRVASDQRQILLLFLMSSSAIALFYGAGLMWGRNTHLSIVEYWRWWVVHLWVEGFFEVFATVVIAFFFMKLGLVKGQRAAEATLLAGTIYLAGGIIGTLHHLYFAGTPTVALAFGSVFSALEVVPLVLIGFTAWDDVRLSRAADWMRNYRWPVYFFLAVAFWNMVGAGLFGFMINPPIALYYMQGLNTTPVHGHAALFGVYGMLGIGLMLFCLKAMRPAARWNERLLGVAFWALNGGLMAMVVLSLLPVGLMQTWASVEHGYAYARSAEFMQTGLMQTLRWLRVPGDTVFALGALVLVWVILTVSVGQIVRGGASAGPTR